MTTVTRLKQNQEQAWEYLKKIIGTRYTWCTSVIGPARGPAWARKGPAPSPQNTRRRGRGRVVASRE